MTDIHSHLIYGVDDGAKTLEESIEILSDLKKCGYDNIILTPHYIKDSTYQSTKEENLKKLKVLRAALKYYNIDLNLYLGNEIYIDDNIYELLQSGKITSLNNTRYLLIELPMSGIYDEYKEIFISLMKKGYRVILAHPERYKSFQEDFNKIYELESIGVYFQSNLDSIVGKYGENAEKIIKRLLKEKKIAFLASDIHHKKHDYDKWKTAKEIALKYITEEEYNILVNENPSQLIG